MRFSSRFSIPFLAVVIAALLPIGAFAAQPEPIAPLVATATTVEWQPAIEVASIVLSLQRPDGQVLTETFAAGRNPMLRVETLNDGLYSYELRAVPRRSERESMRIEGEAAPEKSLVQSGSFLVMNGA